LARAEYARRALADQTSEEARPANPTGPQAAVNLHLPSRPDSPMTARHSLVELEGTVPPETMAKLRLLVTELVANSVRHARGTPIAVTVRLDGELVRAEVSDGGAGFDPPEADPNPLKSVGWGLFLVRKIATRWGTEPETGTVWFELERPAPR
jgi:two-component sensor histidine kinase